MCLPDLIADRTDSLLNGQPEIPAAGMADAVNAGLAACRKLGIGGVIGVPCNTFHAEPIWFSFVSRLEQSTAEFRLVNMIDETVAAVRCALPSGGTVGLLSTTGSREMKLYSRPLAEAGFNVVEAEDQDAVHEMIYSPEWGLKASLPVSGRAIRAVEAEVGKLRERGAELIILGCTELPLAYDDEPQPADLLDPMEILASSLIKAAAPEKLKA